MKDVQVAYKDIWADAILSASLILDGVNLEPGLWQRKLPALSDSVLIGISSPEWYRMIAQMPAAERITGFTPRSLLRVYELVHALRCSPEDQPVVHQPPELPGVMEPPNKDTLRWNRREREAFGQQSAMLRLPQPVQGEVPQFDEEKACGTPEEWNSALPFEIKRVKNKRRAQKFFPAIT